MNLCDVPTLIKVGSGFPQGEILPPAPAGTVVCFRRFCPGCGNGNKSWNLDTGACKKCGFAYKESDRGLVGNRYFDR